jgi:hypothetical protein
MSTAATSIASGDEQLPVVTVSQFETDTGDPGREQW